MLQDNAPFVGRGFRAIADCYMLHVLLQLRYGFKIAASTHFFCPDTDDHRLGGSRRGADGCQALVGAFVCCVLGDDSEL